MEKFDSITDFLKTEDFNYRVYDMGRKVYPISNQDFEQIEKQEQLFPYPFQQKSWLALLFWPENKEDQAVIWFLQFPIDELGYLKQQSRDAFLIDLLEQTGKNIQAKHPSSILEISNNSSKKAPAQNARSPSLCKIIMLTLSSLAKRFIFSINLLSNDVGNELLAG